LTKWSHSFFGLQRLIPYSQLTGWKKQNGLEEGLLLLEMNFTFCKKNSEALNRGASTRVRVGILLFHGEDIDRTSLKHPNILFYSFEPLPTGVARFINKDVSEEWAGRRVGERLKLGPHQLT